LSAFIVKPVQITLLHASSHDMSGT